MAIPLLSSIGMSISLFFLYLSIYLGAKKHMGWKSLSLSLYGIGISGWLFMDICYHFVEVPLSELLFRGSFSFLIFAALSLLIFQLSHSFENKKGMINKFFAAALLFSLIPLTIGLVEGSGTTAEGFTEYTPSLYFLAFVLIILTLCYGSTAHFLIKLDKKSRQKISSKSYRNIAIGLILAYSTYLSAVTLTLARGSLYSSTIASLFFPLSISLVFYGFFLEKK